RLLGNDLQALDDARHHLMFEAGVEDLGIFADDDQIDVLEPRLDAGEISHRAQVRIEIERLSQSDVDAREALPYRRRYRSLQRDFVAADRIDQVHGQRLTGAFHREQAGVVLLPFDRDAGRVEDANDRVGDFGSDAVAGNQGNGVLHS